MTSKTAPTEADKIDLAPWGYAPGSTPIHCIDCDASPSNPLGNVHFLHPHAWRCASHALEARQNAIRAYDGHLVTDPDQELADAALGLIKAATDKWIRRAFIASLILAPAIVALILLI